MGLLRNTVAPPFEVYKPRENRIDEGSKKGHLQNYQPPNRGATMPEAFPTDSTLLPSHIREKEGTAEQKAAMTKWLKDANEESAVDKFLAELKKQAEEGGCAEGDSYTACTNEEWLCNHVFCELPPLFAKEKCHKSKTCPVRFHFIRARNLGHSSDENTPDPYPQLQYGTHYDLESKTDYRDMVKPHKKLFWRDPNPEWYHNDTIYMNPAQAFKVCVIDFDRTVFDSDDLLGCTNEWVLGDIVGLKSYHWKPFDDLPFEAEDDIEGGANQKITFHLKYNKKK